MNKSLREQVEQILDTESDKRFHDVIIQMKPPEDEHRAILEASAAALRRRYLTISPRDLAPPKAELLLSSEASISTSAKRRLRESNSTASQFALKDIPARNVQYFQEAGWSALSTVHQTDAFRQTLQATTGKRTKGGNNAITRQRAKGSWSSRSIFLRVKRGHLEDFATSVDGVGGIYPNGTISTPPVVEVKNSSTATTGVPGSAWGLETIGALSVWGAYDTRGKPSTNGAREPSAAAPVRVAVLDTGVDPTHPALQGKIAAWAEFDKQGVPVNSRPHDSGKHGTHVCGTIAGGTQRPPSTKSPLIGVAPDAELMVALVLNGTSGTHAQILAGLDWAIENGAEIINMSLGGVHLQPDVIDLYTQSIISANSNGIPVVVSIGNEGAQTTGLPGNDYYAFSVGATDHTDRAAGFSGGRTQVITSSRYIGDDYLPMHFSKPEVTAPGVAIQSCTPKGGYETWNGTSMAAPHVSGALALLLAATNIRAVPSSRRAYLLQDLIISSVEELGEAGRDHRFGFGRLNAFRAVAMACRTRLLGKSGQISG